MMQDVAHMTQDTGLQAAKRHTHCLLPPPFVTVGARVNRAYKLPSSSRLLGWVRAESSCTAPLASVVTNAAVKASCGTLGRRLGVSDSVFFPEGSGSRGKVWRRHLDECQGKRTVFSSICQSDRCLAERHDLICFTEKTDASQRECSSVVLS